MGNTLPVARVPSRLLSRAPRRASRFLQACDALGDAQPDLRSAGVEALAALGFVVGLQVCRFSLLFSLALALLQTRALEYQSRHPPAEGARGTSHSRGEASARHERARASRGASSGAAAAAL